MRWTAAPSRGAVLFIHSMSPEISTVALETYNGCKRTGGEMRHDPLHTEYSIQCRRHTHLKDRPKVICKDVSASELNCILEYIEYST